MADALDIAVSGLRSFQTALATTSNNIANVNTPGYSRQVVDIGTIQPQGFGNGFIGRGSQVVNIQRIESEFLTEQLRNATTEAGRLGAVSTLASRVDNLLADNGGSLAPSLENFFSSLQDLSVDPSSSSARQVVLSSAESLTSRFSNIESQLAAIDRDIDIGIRENVQLINSLAGNISNLNQQIVAASSITSGTQVPNGLLDQRDQLVLELSEIVAVQTIDQADGSLSVFVGSGQSLVVGSLSQDVVAIRDPSDGTKTNIAFRTATSQADITSAITGGTLNGLLEFRNEQLGTIRNELGRIAQVIGGTFNEQHRNGQTINGDLGADFFAVGPVDVIANANNSGAAAITATISDVTALTPSDYEIRFDGANYTLTRLDDGFNVASATGAFAVDGVQINVGAGASAGDRFLVRPTRLGAQQIDVLINRTNEIAAASPVRTSVSINNLSDASISNPVITDINNADLRDTVEIRFNDPASTYDVFNVTDGATIVAGAAYTSGADISFNGITVQVEGPVRTGDVFLIESNTSGVSDNTNATALLELQTANTVSGSANYQEAYGGLIGLVGTVTRQANINSQAQSQVLINATEARDSVSGVNLDEEAVNLTRFQQSFQAAARVISVSNEIFQSLLLAVGR